MKKTLAVALLAVAAGCDLTTDLQLGGGGLGTNALALSNIAATSITDTSAEIDWSTNLTSTSTVEYGLDATYGSATPLYGLTLNHAVPLTGLAPGTLYHYRVTSEDASTTTSSADATFTTLGGDAGSGNGPGISLSPASVSFGNQLVGSTSAVQFINVTNPGNAALSLQPPAISGSGFAFAGLGTCTNSLAPGSSCTYSVDFTPSAAGASSGAVTINDDAPGAPHAVPLSGNGSSTSIFWRATSTFATGASTTSTQSVTLAAPAGASAGDVLVASLALGNSGATVLPQLTAPTGWSLVRETDDGTFASLAVFTHAFAAGETSYTFTLDQPVWGVAWVSAYANVNASCPVDAEAGASASSAPSVTTSAPGDLLVASFMGYSGTSGSPGTWTAPSGFTLRANLNNTDMRSGAGADAPQAQAGASGAEAGTQSVALQYAAAHVMALLPAGAACNTGGGGSDAGYVCTGNCLYVSTAGNDGNPGTLAAPLRHLSQTVGRVQPGTTVVVMDGFYDNEGVSAASNPNSVVWLGTSGQAGAPITYVAQHTGQAILNGGNTITGNGATYNGPPYPCDGAWAYFNLSDVNYVTVQGFVIEQTCVTSIEANGNPGYAHDITIRNNELRNIGDSWVNTGQGGPQGIYFNGSGYNELVDGNVIHDVGNVNNTLHNQNHGIYTQASNSQFINNVMYNIPSGWGFQIAPGTTNILVANNTLADVDPNRQGQIILWDNGDGFSQPLQNVVFENNIFYDASGYAIVSYLSYAMSGCVMSNNLTTAGSFYDEGEACSESANLVGTDPSLVNPPSDFHLNAGSAARGVGLNLSSSFSDDLAGATRPASGPWNLGAYR